MRRKKLSNSVVDAWNGTWHGEPVLYTSGTRVGQLVEQPVLWDTEIRGFGVRYSIRGRTRTYILQFRVKGTGNERTLTIGRHNDPYRVDQARAKALELKAQMVSGVDPVLEAERVTAARAAQAGIDRAQSITLREGLAHYLENKRTKHGPLRPKTKASIKENIERHLSAWIDKPMATITREACLTRFAELSDKELNRNGKVGKKATGNLVFVYLRAICNHIRKVTANEDGTPRIFIANPVTLMLDIRKLNPEKPRTGRIPKDRVGHTWLTLQRRRANARDIDDRTAADWVSTMFLTGMRLTESGSLRWSQIDWTAKTIRLLGDVADAGDGFAGVKNHNDMLIPMSTVLHDLLLERKREPDVDPKVARRRRNQRSKEYVFASCGKKKPYMTDARATMEAVSKAAGCHTTPHNLRRTLEDIAKAVRIDPDERRQLLNHLASDVHGESYANNPDPEVLRPAVEAVARYIVDAATVAEAQESGANVVTFPARA